MADGLATPVRSLAGLLLSRRRRRVVLRDWRRRLAGEPRLPDGPVRALLILCQGNLCRSPYAAALLDARLAGLFVRSAGLDATDGDPADPSAQRAAARTGACLKAHRARQVTDRDIAAADLIVAMERAHVADVCRRWPEAAARTFLLGDFLPGPPFEIGDPWGRSDAVFDATFARIRHAADRLAALLAERPA